MRKINREMGYSHETLFIIISFKVMNSAAKNRFILKLGIQIYTKNEIN